MVNPSNYRRETGCGLTIAHRLLLMCHHLGSTLLREIRGGATQGDATYQLPIKAHT